MKTLGITGGIGTGKTTVCQLFETLGATVFYADAEAKQILHEDPEAQAEIQQTFGPESYADGTLNRGYLAAQVFGNEAQLARLNQIVHPRVFAAFETRKQTARAEGSSLLIKEAALIFEVGGEAFLDAVAVVEAPLELRLQRVMARDGATRAAVLARMAHQWPPEQLRERADFIIQNDGSRETLHPQVRHIYDLLVGDAPENWV